jgi:hypothetical protein
VACSSTPDVSGITVQQGSKVNLINRTGTSTTVVVDSVPGVTLAAGMSVRVRLKAGQHSVALRPDCVFVGAVDTLVVTVITGDWIAPESTPTQNSPPSSAPGTAGTGGTDSAGVPPRVRSGAGTSSAGLDDNGGVAPPRAAQSGSTAATPAGSVRTSPSGGNAAPPEFGSFDPPSLAGEEGSDPRGGRLLAVIALICELGVTAGIIRAIVAQRADGAITTQT